jgi:hypothetical protein
METLVDCGKDSEDLLGSIMTALAFLGSIDEKIDESQEEKPVVYFGEEIVCMEVFMNIVAIKKFSLEILKKALEWKIKEKVKRFF